MAKFAIIRLGKDSVGDIRAIDALHASPATPLSFTVTCTQVPTELAAGDFVFVCLGSDNNKGGATDWTRGIRALGTVTSKTGGPGRNDPWFVGLEVKVVVPESVTHKRMLAKAPAAYFWCASMPVIGVDSYANQTVQMIKEADPNQSVQALAFGINAIHPSFKVETLAAYPVLEPLFNYVPPDPNGVSAGSVAAGVSSAVAVTAGVGSIDLSKIVEQFLIDSEASGLRVEESSARRFFASLLTKRFLIATGLAGSGKTKLAQALAAWLTPMIDPTKPEERAYVVVPVGADWTGNENILGYSNGLDESSYVSKPTLDLIIRARDNPAIPHILILDEMNLSHVERYFADILSVIESDERIHLHRDAERKADGIVVPKEIELPKNLFIIGTVNVDETTYMFSPKVLDRANVIEFRMEEAELEAFLGNPAKPDMAMFAGKGSAFGTVFLNAASSKAPPFQAALQLRYEAEMLLFFKVLRGNGAEFGYRVAHEAARFIHFYKIISGHDEVELSWLPVAFDRLIAQKFLPKLHGSRTKLGPLLKKLWFLCVSDDAARGANPFDATDLAAKSTEKNAEPSVVVPSGAIYPLSAEKIGRMWRLLNDNGFASFAEA